MTGSPKSRSAAERVAAQLTTWPGLEAGRPSCGAGRSFSFQGGQILHLHTGEEADLRLSRVFIQRLDKVLVDSGHVVTRPDDDWVTVLLDTDTDGAMLISLMSLAIHAASEPKVTQPCTWQRARPSGRLRAYWA
ncbi:MAG TPA: luciferase family protein [Actinoallomurus sp.]